MVAGALAERRELVDWLGFDQMVVVEDKDDPVGEGGYLVDQRSQDGLSRWRLQGD